MPRLTYIRKWYDDGYRGGDYIYDTRMARALREIGVSVEEVVLRESPLQARILSSARHLAHPMYGSYDDAENVEKIRSAVLASDGQVVLSHEALVRPYLAAAVSVETVFIFHNMFSEAIGRIGLHSMFRRRARQLECAVSTTPLFKVATLSHREHLLARSVFGRERAILLPPGVPSAYSTFPSSAGPSELICTGTSDWGLKRRDHDLAVRQLGRMGIALRDCSSGEIPDDGKLRFGLIPDRFSMGFKLKASDYIARNCAVISMSAVKPDFDPSMRPDLSVVEIDSWADVNRAIRSIESSLNDICSEVHELKKKWSAEMTWTSSAEKLKRAMHV